MINTNRRLEDLTPAMQARVKDWLKLCEENNLKVQITETKRTKLRQLYLWSMGRYVEPAFEKKYLGYDDPAIAPNANLNQAQVTWTLNSNHLKGEAIDFGFLKDGKFTYEGDWAKAYDLAEEVGLKSLFRTTGKDKPHLEFDHSWVPSEFLEAKKWVIKQGISNGERPKDPITREEAWLMLQRSLKKLIEWTK